MFKYLAVYLIFISNVYAGKNSECSLDKLIHLKGHTTVESSPIRLKVVGDSAENGEAYLYYLDQKLHMIKSVLYGETGKVEVNYYFESEDSKTYLVEYSEFRYTAPISYKPAIEIASKSTHTFSVCGEKKDNYPDSDSTIEIKKNAINILKKIKKLKTE